MNEKDKESNISCDIGSSSLFSLRDDLHDDDDHNDHPQTHIHENTLMKNNSTNTTTTTTMTTTTTTIESYSDDNDKFNKQKKITMNISGIEEVERNMKRITKDMRMIVRQKKWVY